MGDLVEIAIALQRQTETRLLGTDLFENLMEAGAYDVDRVMEVLDRRAIR